MTETQRSPSQRYHAPMNRHADALGWIDAQAPSLADALVALAEINSGSFNATGVDRVGEAMVARFAPLADTVERIALAPFRSTADDGRSIERAVGHALRLRKRAEAPIQVLLCGHMDTVYGADHPFQHTRIEGDTLHGPGVADLKGGLLVMWLALSALERSPLAAQIGWTVLLNPDEEIGSRSSAPLLVEAAKQHHLGLVYEPAYADGNLASARKGSGVFDVIVHGRAAHAGRNPQDGRNALVAAADFIAQLDALNGQREGVTINPGYVHGGGALNIVPDLCVFKFNVRTGSPADECWLQDQLDLLLTRLQARDGIHAELRGAFTRPPKVFDAPHETLARWIGDCGKELGLQLAFKPTGGCCDGNNLAAQGLTNIDNLGVVGGDIHSEREWMRLSSLAERGKLSALLLLRLASGEYQLKELQAR